MLENQRNSYNQYDSCYDNIGDFEDPCVYCGYPSTDWDHVPPIHFIARLIETDVNVYQKYRLRKVRSCHQCNSTLRGLVITTIAERKSYLLEHYKKKYKRIIETPRWGDDEIAEITGRTLCDSVRVYQKFQITLSQRLAILRDPHMYR